YTTVFPLRSKGEVSAVLIPWIRTVRLQLRERFGQDLPVLRLHTERGGEFSSDLLLDFSTSHWLSHGDRSTLWPHVSLPETSPTLRWTGKVGDASVIRIWGSRAFVCDTPADKLSARALPCVFLGFVPDVPGWQFYHHTLRRVLPSQDVTFDESVPFYHLFPYLSAPFLPPPLFLAPSPPPVDPLPPQGPAPSGVSQVDPLPGTAPVQVAVVPGAAPGAVSRGSTSGGAEPGGAGSEGAGFGGAEPEGVEPGGAESEGAEPWGAEPRARGAAVTTGAGDPTEPGAAGVEGAGVGGPGAGGSGAAGAGAVDPGAGGAGGTVRPRLYFVPLLQQPASRPVSPVRTARCVPRSRPPPVPRTHTMALRPSSVSLRFPLPAPPESSLLEVPDPESDRARAASPTVARLLATAFTNPSFESAVASALVAELLDFAAACRLDYTTAQVGESVSASPPSVGGECALGTDVLEDRQEDFECLAAAVPRFASSLLAPEGDPNALDISTPRSYAEAITGPYSSQWQAAMDVDMASWKSTGTYVDEVPPPGVNIVDGMWILRVKRPPGSPLAFKRDYELHSLDFSTAFLQGSLHEEIWLRRPPGFTRSFHAEYVDDLVFATADTEALTLVKSELQKRHTCTNLGELRSYLGLQITRDRARCTITLTQSHMVHQALQRFGFQYSSPQLTPLSTSHSLSTPPSDKSVEPSGLYPELVGCLMYLMTCTRPDLVYPLSLLARYVAPVRRAWGLCLEDGVQLSSLVTQTLPGSSCEAEMYAGDMAAQELRWLTYLLTDMGDQPRSPPNLYQRGQLRLAYVATWANTADVFTKALPPGDHQSFVTVLGLLALLCFFS
ncbi:unnamed protein product, partial [Closterium sp. NIES-53]